MQSIRKTIGGFGNLMFKEAYLLGKAMDGTIPDHYVQSETYWEKYAPAIRQHFSEGIGYTDKVAIHIRRGDYLDASHFHVSLWETDYYKRAIELFPDEQFIVFCKDNQDWRQDKADREWCRQNIGPLIGDRYELPSPYNKEEQDFNLMASCKAIIMANSSFSWWAAYLGDPNKKVICPTQWYTDGVQRTQLLDRWTKL